MQNILIKYVAVIPYAPSQSPLVPNLNFTLTVVRYALQKEFLHCPFEWLMCFAYLVYKPNIWSI